MGPTALQPCRSYHAEIFHPDPAAASEPETLLCVPEGSVALPASRSIGAPRNRSYWGSILYIYFSIYENQLCRHPKQLFPQPKQSYRFCNQNNNIDNYSIDSLIKESLLFIDWYLKVHLLMHFIIYLICFQTQGFLEDVSNLKEHG